MRASTPVTIVLPGGPGALPDADARRPERCKARRTNAAPAARRAADTPRAGAPSRGHNHLVSLNHSKEEAFTTVSWLRNKLPREVVASLAHLLQSVL